MAPRAGQVFLERYAGGRVSGGRWRAEDLPKPSGVDGDDLTAPSTHQQDPVETLGEHLQELHVCEFIAVKGQHLDCIAPSARSACLDSSVR